MTQRRLPHALGFVVAGLLAAGVAQAQPLFSDDFEDRVRDQATIGNGWTWYEQTFESQVCEGDPIFQVGPFDTPEDDYEQANRNYWTASEEEAGQGDSYFRAGLEVPAWVDQEGNSPLGNMLRVYGNPFNEATSCHRVLIFKELRGFGAGTYTFSFDMAQDRDGAPANGEITAAFVKILKESDGSYATIVFETELTRPPAASSPSDVTSQTVSIDFTVTEELVGELLQVGFYNDVVRDLGQDPFTSAVLYDNINVDLMEIGPAHSGSWYNASQDGHGFSIEFGYLPDGTPWGVVYWYTYDDQGNPIFMLGNGSPDGQRLEIDLVSPSGMIYGEFNPIEEPPIGGTATFDFSDRNNAVFNYTPSDYSMATWGHMTPIEDLPITKLFGIPADKLYQQPD